jgi:hypothetical protein
MLRLHDFQLHKLSLGERGQFCRGIWNEIRKYRGVRELRFVFAIGRSVSDRNVVMSPDRERKLVIVKLMMLCGFLVRQSLPIRQSDGLAWQG